MPLTRRTLLATALAIAPRAAATENPLAALERAHGGRLGVFALSTNTSRTLSYRADERFLMCSTFKLLLAATIFSRVEAGTEHLDRLIPYAAPDLLAYAPTTRAHLAEGALPIRALCQAAVEVSDNTAANLLLAAIGGPPSVTRFARTLGDQITRLDRTELALNTPSGPLDTTTPRAMATTIHAILLGNALSAPHRAMLEAWMIACTTGRNRLRAGLPRAWTAGDKTGTGATQTNDLALIRPPGRAPIVVAAYYEGGNQREAVLRAVGELVAG